MKNNNNIKNAMDALRAIQQASISVMSEVQKLRPQMNISDDEFKDLQEKLNIPTELNANMSKFKSVDDVVNFTKKFNL